MGVARAGNLETVGQSNAQVIDGGLRFDSSKSHYLSRTFSTGNRKTWSLSFWTKRFDAGTGSKYFFSTLNNGGNSGTYLYLNLNNLRYWDRNSSTDGLILTTNAVIRDTSSWYHILLSVNYSASTNTDRAKIYINGIEQTYSATSYPGTTEDSYTNANTTHYIAAPTAYYDGSISQFYFIDGQALTPSSFGYTDPLTNTWRPKKYTGTYGTNGCWLPMDGNTPIGQDRSGNNNNWTPVNFGGSNTIEKATGALPILNTDGGGKVARVGVRTDSNASSLVLALPLVGIKSDFSNAINSGTSNKTVTVTNAVASSTQSNFYGGSWYFDGNGDYIVINNNSDLQFGTGVFTIETWFYANTYNSITYPTIISKYDNSDVAWIIRLKSDGKIIWYSDTAGGTNNESSNSVIQLNKWHHIAAVREGTGSNQMKVYIDGVLVLTTTDGANYNETNNIYVGRQDGTNTNYFDGYLQDLRIYKGLAKYTQNFIPASTDPDILPDTPSGVAYSSNVALVPSTDGSFFFSGPNSAIQDASPGYTVGTSAYTFECWAMARSWGDSNIIGLFGFQFGRYASNNGIGIAYASWELYTDWLPSTNLWYHYAITRDGSGVTRLFINGNLEVSATINTNYGAPTTAAVGGGPQSTPLNGFDGFISNARFVLGSALYTAKFTPSSTPLESTGAQTKFLGCQSNSSTSSIAVNSGTVSVKGTINASNFNPFTVNINTQRGQESGYPTLNPLDKPSSASVTISNGNLRATDGNSGSYSLVVSNAGLSTSNTDTGYYLEVTNLKTTSGNSAYTGFSFWRVGGGAYNNLYPPGTATYNPNNGYTYSQNGGVTPWGGSTVSSQPTWQTAGDVFSVAVKGSNVWFAKNGIWISGNPATGTSPYTTIPSGYGQVFPAALALETGDQEFNFGQKPFKFPPPAGFQPLALANTPRPTTVRPDQYVGIVTYMGNGTSQSINVGFKPDFVWIKSRSNNFGHWLTDSVRGVSKQLQSNSTGTEQSYDMITAFNLNGFSLGTDDAVNGNTYTHVAWCWKAGGQIGVGRSFMIDNVGFATAGDAGMNTGTITPTGASVNTKSGFSIIAFNSGSNGQYTISHGLRKAPALILCKDRDSILDWQVFHVSATTDVYKYFWLNSTQSINTDASKVWGDNLPTSTVFGFSTGNNQLANKNIICYCWAEIPGFSKFGSYTGNGSTNFVNVGFRPRWIMIKRAVTNSSPDSTNNYSSWTIYDTSRNTYNGQTPNHLYANKNINEGYRGNASDTSSLTDMTVNALSNGFYLSGAGTEINANTGTYIYAAFAETPSFNLYGGQSNAR